MKRLLSLLLILTILATTLPVNASTGDYSGYDTFLEYAASLGYTSTMEISIIGEVLPLNEYVYNKYGWFVYGTPEDVDLSHLEDGLPAENEPYTLKEYSTGDADYGYNHLMYEKGKYPDRIWDNEEYRYLGYAPNGEVFSNTYYPNDAPSSDPTKWLSQFIKLPDAPITWSAVVNDLHKKFIVQQTLSGNGINTTGTANSDNFCVETINNTTSWDAMNSYAIDGETASYDKTKLLNVGGWFSQLVVRTQKYTSSAGRTYQTFYGQPMAGDATQSLNVQDEYTMHADENIINVPVTYSVNYNLSKFMSADQIENFHVEIKKNGSSVTSIPDDSDVTSRTVEATIAINRSELNVGTNNVKIAGSYAVTTKLADSDVQIDSTMKTVVINVETPVNPTVLCKVTPNPVFKKASGGTVAVKVTVDATLYNITPANIKSFKIYEGSSSQSATYDSPTALFNRSIEIPDDFDGDPDASLTTTWNGIVEVTLQDGRVLTATDTAQTVIVGTPQKPYVDVDAPQKIKMGNIDDVSVYAWSVNGEVVYTRLKSDDDGVIGSADSFYYENDYTFTKTGTVEWEGMARDVAGYVGFGYNETLVLPPTVDAVVHTEGILKPFRKVTLNTSKSDSPTLYPIIDASTDWTLTDGTLSISNLVKNPNNPDGNRKFYFGARTDGTFNASAKLTNTAGYSDTDIKTVTIVPDEAPVADFTTINRIYRNPLNANLATVSLFNKSYSPDNDTLGYMTVKYYYDEDNDGDYFEHTAKTAYDGAYQATYDFNVAECGKYYVELSVKEDYTPMEGLEDEAIYLTANSADSDRASSTITSGYVVDVDNFAPTASLVVQPERKIDIAVQLANTDITQAEIETYLNGTLTQQLEQQGVTINSTTVYDDGGMQIIEEDNTLYNIRGQIKNINTEYWVMRQMFVGERYNVFWRHHNATNDSPETSPAPFVYDNVERELFSFDTLFGEYFGTTFNDSYANYSQCYLSNPMRTKTDTLNGTETVYFYVKATLYRNYSEFASKLPYTFNGIVGLTADGRHLFYPISTTDKVHNTTYTNSVWGSGLVSLSYYDNNYDDRWYSTGMIYSSNIDSDLLYFDSYVYKSTDTAMGFYTSTGQYVVTDIRQKSNKETDLSDVYYSHDVSGYGGYTLYDYDINRSEYYVYQNGVTEWGVKTLGQSSFYYQATDDFIQSPTFNLYSRSDLGFVHHYHFTDEYTGFFYLPDDSDTDSEICWDYNKFQVYHFQTNLREHLTNTFVEDTSAEQSTENLKFYLLLDDGGMDLMVERESSKISDAIVANDIGFATNNQTTYADAWVNTNNGASVDSYSEFGDYIMDTIYQKNNAEGSDVYLVAGDTLAVDAVFEDYENDVIDTKGIIATHADPNYFDHGNGTYALSGVEQEIQDFTLNEVGKYTLELRARDNPIGSNTALDEYRKWSDSNVTQTVYVHRKPFAEGYIDFDSFDEDSLTYSGIKWVDESYDLDHNVTLKGSTRGIQDIEIESQYYVYNMASGTYETSDWEDGLRDSFSIPYGSGKITVNVRAQDLEGAWSDVYTTTLSLSSAPHILKAEVKPELDTMTLDAFQTGNNVVWYNVKTLFQYDHYLLAKLLDGTTVLSSKQVNMPSDITQDADGWYIWDNVIFPIPSGLSEKDYTLTLQSMKVSSGTNSNIVSGELKTLDEAIEITDFDVVGAWQHWDGRRDYQGYYLMDMPHRFLSLEEVTFYAKTTGDVGRAEIRLSPELEAMLYTDPYGHVYPYADIFEKVVSFPLEMTATSYDAAQDETTWAVTYFLPLAKSTLNWSDLRAREPYSAFLNVTSTSGALEADAEIDDIDITGNIYDRISLQPKYH